MGVKAGSIAKDALKDLDRDVLKNEDAPIAVARLESSRLLLLGAVDQAESAELRKWLEQHEGLQSRLEEVHRPKHQSRVEQITADNDNHSAWRSLGLSKRLTIIRLNPIVRNTLLLFLTLVDFMVFARAIAVAQDVNPVPSNAEFWFGGVLGIFVSIAAFFVGHTLKHRTLAPAQARLRKAILQQNPETEIPVPADRGDGAVLISGAVFILLLAFAGIMRLQANVEENLGLLAFQLLLPVMIVVIEFLVHDPLTHTSARRSLSHWLLERRNRKTESRIGRLREKFEFRRSGINGMFANERMILLSKLQKLHIEYPPDGDDQVALLLTKDQRIHGLLRQAAREEQLINLAAQPVTVAQSVVGPDDAVRINE